MYALCARDRQDLCHDLCNDLNRVSHECARGSELGERERESTLSSTKVLVTANAQPTSNARRIIALLVHGVALASPNGFSKCRVWPLVGHTISTLTSTASIGVQKRGSRGCSGTALLFPKRLCSQNYRCELHMYSYFPISLLQNLSLRWVFQNRHTLSKHTLAEIKTHFFTTNWEY